MEKICKYCVFYENGKCEDSKGPNDSCDEFLLDETLLKRETSISQDEKVDEAEEAQNEVDLGQNVIENSTDMEPTLQSSTLDLEKSTEKLEELDEKLNQKINVNKKDKKIIITIDLSSLFE
ncbi:hypothetical protein J7J62_08120 [bacterium]|nr:hypothetical protein [bacterium]